MKKLIAQLLVLALAIPAWTTGCYKRVEIPKDQLVDQTSFAPLSGWIYVAKSRTEDGVHKLNSFKIENGRLIGEEGTIKGVREATIPLQDLQSIESRYFSAGKTTLAVLGCAGIIGLIFGIIFLSKVASGGLSS